ncbi:hypothetical protein Lesp02_44060 [Lentzea sp. NBRC 105346]|nr:hypothetical protein Lesp02_44060 [Lentzea sp. NBRC 105346]
MKLNLSAVTAGHVELVDVAGVAITVARRDTTDRAPLTKRPLSCRAITRRSGHAGPMTGTPIYDELAARFFPQASRRPDQASPQAGEGAPNAGARQQHAERPASPPPT